MPSHRATSQLSRWLIIFMGLNPTGIHDAIVEHLNKYLERTDLLRRVYALETDELDWRVFLACEPDVASVLSAAGQTRKLYL